MSSNFDPSRVGQRGESRPRGPKAERVFLQVKEYETPADGFHYAIGHRVGNTEELVKVRLNTVAERTADRPDMDAEKIKAQYAGEKSRDTIADKAKGNIHLIAFDDARLIGEEDGIKVFRAHWPNTMSTDPKAEAMIGTAHIKLEEAGERFGRQQPARAYVEMLKPGQMVDKDNVVQALNDALAIKDDQGRARDPLVIMRVMHEGNVLAQPRMYPITEPKEVFDQATGEKKTVNRPADNDVTMAFVVSDGATKSDMTNRQLDQIRAVIAGLKGQDEPKFITPDANSVDAYRNLYYGAKEGAVQVEVIAAEKLDFGSESRKTYLKNKDQSHLAAYSIKEANEDGTRRKESPGYAETVVTVQRHPDGEPYVVHVAPTAMFPKPQKLQELASVADAAPAAEATKPKEPEPIAPIHDDDDYAP